MPWHEVITDGFPPPHDAEPSTLRADIADELADHLACAMQSELRRADNEAAACRTVLERFGDIKQLARRLWWDAMKERIMKDRIFSVVLVLATLAFVAAFVLPWVAHQREIDAAILAKLETLGTHQGAPPPAVPENWAKLTVRVVRGDDDGPPVPDVKIDLNGRAFASDVNSRTLRETTDSAGRADYGPILPGVYSLRVFAGDLDLRMRESITLYPGQDPEQIIHYPDLVGPARLQFKVEPADALQRFDAVIKCRLVPNSPIGPWNPDSMREVIVDAAGRIVSLKQGVGDWKFKRQIPGFGTFAASYLNVANPLDDVREMTIAPASWSVSEVVVGTGILPHPSWVPPFPDTSYWLHNDDTRYTPEGPISWSATAGQTDTIAIQVPDGILHTLELITRRRSGVADVPATLIADETWPTLRETARETALAAMTLARKHGESVAALDAYERAQEAEQAMRDREAELLRLPPPPTPRARIDRRGRPLGAPELTEAEKEQAELEAARSAAAEEVSTLYHTHGYDDPRLTEAVQRMRELERQLEELDKSEAADDEPSAAPASSSTRPDDAKDR